MDSESYLKNTHRVNSKYDRSLAGFHYPFQPEDLRPEDLIYCQFSGTQSKFSLLRYSPMGFEFLCSEKSSKDIRSKLHCEIFFPGVEPVYYRVEFVGEIANEDGTTLIAFRIHAMDSTERSSAERRKARRWSCSEVFAPTAVAPNPLKFDDYILFRIDDISKSGLRLITSPRNKLIHKNMILDLTINLPFAVNVTAKAEVIYVDATDLEGEISVLVGARFVNLELDDLAAVAEYLMAIGSEASASDLKKEGFPVSKRALKADLKYARTEEEYREVLNLRKIAYSEVGKVKPDIEPETFRDVFDSRSRILISRRHGKLVGSVRLTFHEKFEDSELFSEGVKEIPNFDIKLCAEASRLCTLPEMRGSDSAFELIAFLTLTAIKAGKRYLFGSAHGSMLDFYRRLGWTVTDIKISKEIWGGISESVVIVDVFDAVLAKNCAASVWKRVYRDVYFFLISQERITPSYFESLKIKAIEAFT